MVRFMFRVLLIALVMTSVGFGGLAMAKRMHTGTWSMPNKHDVAWLQHAFVAHDEPPRIIYLNREAITVMGGFDDAAENRSQLLALDSAERRLPGFAGNDRAWQRVVQCVRNKFSDFEVRITDRRPNQRHGYVMVHVGGTPADLFGVERDGMGGVAPFNSDVIGDAMVFAFSDTLSNKVQSVCETVAHEVGHIYGLDHSYRCSDVMTYLHGCGNKRFVHANVRCGESERRDCDSGTATQNSHARLMDVLGPSARRRTVAYHHKNR